MILIKPRVQNVADYLGLKQDTIMGELLNNTAVTRLAKWNDTNLLADKVRDLNYADRGDRTFDWLPGTFWSMGT